MENRKMVFTTEYEHNATMMKDRLLSNGIDTLILDQHDSISEVIGSFELYVLNEDFDKAKAVVEEQN